MVESKPSSQTETNGPLLDLLFQVGRRPVWRVCLPGEMGLGDRAPPPGKALFLNNRAPAKEFAGTWRANLEQRASGQRAALVTK